MFNQSEIVAFPLSNAIYPYNKISFIISYLDASDLDDIRFQLGRHHITDNELSELEQVKRDWLESLLETKQAHPFSDEVVAVQNPVMKVAKVARQGPFLYQP